MRDARPTGEGAPVPAGELPSPRALRRATAVAVLVAAVLVVTAVLPAEYDVDPTGIGALLGLKEIGEVKREAVEEEAEAARIDSLKAAAAGADSARGAAADSTTRR